MRGAFAARRPRLTIGTAFSPGMAASASRSRLVVQPSNLRGYRGLTMDAFGTLLEGGPMMLPRPLEHAAEVSASMSRPTLEEMWITTFRKHLQTEPYIAFREIHRMSFEELRDRLRLHTTVEEWVDETFDDYRNAKAYPEVPAVLRELEQDVPLAVVSNMDTTVLLRALQKNGLHFSFVIASDEEQQYKPSSSMFSRAVRYLGLPPSHVLHVGDSYPEDVVGATSMGMGSLLMRRDAAHPNRKDQLSGSTRVVHDLTEVRDFLRRSWSEP